MVGLVQFSKFRINEFFKEILVTFIVSQVDVRYYDDHHILDRSESNIVICLYEAGAYSQFVPSRKSLFVKI